MRTMTHPIRFPLTEGMVFLGSAKEFAEEFRGEEVIVHRPMGDQWIVYHITDDLPAKELIILPDDDGGAGRRFMIHPDPPTLPVGGWGLWNGKGFTRVYRTYHPELNYEEVWIRLLPDDELDLDELIEQTMALFQRTRTKTSTP